MNINKKKFINWPKNYLLIVIEIIKSLLNAADKLLNYIFVFLLNREKLGNYYCSETWFWSADDGKVYSQHQQSTEGDDRIILSCHDLQITREMLTLRQPTHIPNIG